MTLLKWQRQQEVMIQKDTIGETNVVITCYTYEFVMEPHEKQCQKDNQGRKTPMAIGLSFHPLSPEEAGTIEGGK